MIPRFKIPFAAVPSVLVIFLSSVFLFQVDRTAPDSRVIEALMISGASNTTRSLFLMSPLRFHSILKNVLRQDPEVFRIADSSNPLPPSYVPPDLVSLDPFPIESRVSGMLLRKEACDSALMMVLAARRDGVTLVFSSCWRSFDYQKTLKENAERTGGSDSDLTLPAGHSQHQLGTTIDFLPVDDMFAKTPAGIWVAKNAGSYGFSLSYPSGNARSSAGIEESWHWRYITEWGVRLQDEFFGGSQEEMLAFLAVYRILSGESHPTSD